MCADDSFNPRLLRYTCLTSYPNFIPSQTMKSGVENSPIWVTFIGATVRYRQMTYAYGKIALKRIFFAERKKTIFYLKGKRKMFSLIGKKILLEKRKYFCKGRRKFLVL